MAGSQQHGCWLMSCYREQARSHKGLWQRRCFQYRPKLCGSEPARDSGLPDKLIYLTPPAIAGKPCPHNYLFPPPVLHPRRDTPPQAFYYGGCLFPWKSVDE